MILWLGFERCRRRARVGPHTPAPSMRRFKEVAGLGADDEFAMSEGSRSNREIKVEREKY